jgi:ZIP family zinc transporter
VPGLVLAALVTALATGIGAIPVYALGAERAKRLGPAMWGLVVGVMAVASIQGLLIPGFDEASAGSVLGGLVVGLAFLLYAERAVARREAGIGSGGLRGRQALLVFLVLFVHSLPEGLALGAAWASHTSGLGLFVFLAIAIQNVPEGTATAIPLRESGTSAWRAFWLATLTSAPQPVGAVIAYELVALTHSLLGASFGFAAGAMLALIAVELLPTAARSESPREAAVSTVVFAAIMVVIGLALAVD